MVWQTYKVGYHLRIWNGVWCCLITLPNGSVYNVYSMGPSTEPCGTPNSNGVRSDLIPSIITKKWRPVKYDENHFNTVPDNPNDNDRRCNIMWWSRVSNAADRFRRDRIDTIPSSAALSRSQVIRRRAVSVQWFSLYADWNGSTRLFLPRWFFNCSRTTFSRIFEMNGTFETGRKFFRLLGSRLGFLIRGVIAAVLKAGGTTPSLKEAFIKFFITSIMSSICCCNKSDGIGSKEHRVKTTSKVKTSS